MAKTFPTHNYSLEQDYIDSDLNTSTLLCMSAPSPRNSREFEFQMYSNPKERDSMSVLSPADELFYKGNLLPLHLPHRIQMVERLIHSTNTTIFEQEREELEEEIKPTICKSESKPNAYCYEFPTLPTQSSTKKSWSKRFRVIGNSSLSQKLKASGSYIKSLFSKSACSDESCEVSKCKDSVNGGKRRHPIDRFHQERCAMAETNPTSLKSSIEKEKLMEEEMGQRKSFSGIIKRNLTTKSSYFSPNSSCSSCSSYSSSNSSSTLNSNGFFTFYNPSPLLIRSSSVNSEVESSIQGAIAYCKKSHHQFAPGRKSVSDISFFSF